MIITRKKFSSGALVALLTLASLSSFGADKPPYLTTFSKPAAGSMQILFHGTTGPFMIQARDSLDPAAPWVDVPAAVVTEMQPGVFMAFVPGDKSQPDLSFYRVVSEGDSTAELKGWTILLRSSSPANGIYFDKGEAPVITVTLLDTMGQGLSRADFGSLNLYMYGPQDPTLTVSANKLLNANTDRTKTPHHYIDLKSNTNATVSGTVLGYKLQPITDEKPGTYTIAVWSSLASDGIQQIMKFANIQIGTKDVETASVSRDNCAACHEGPVSGKLYMHHIDPGFSPAGNWALDYQPVTSCYACHNNDGYAAYTDASAAGGRVSDHIIRRVHGLHNGASLALPFNTNSTTGDFRMYTGLQFPKEIKNCAACHADDRWKTKPNRLACGSCHDNIWFGAKNAVPADQVAHHGGPQADDSKCAVCHLPDRTDASIFDSITENHAIAPPAMNTVDIAMTRPGNTNYYVAGETPVISLVLKDDSGKPIDHSTVSDANFSTASLFVYGPRAQAIPVLTTTAASSNTILRASVTSAKGGPWDIAGKIFKLAINGSAAQSIPINGTAGAVTPAEVVASLNTVITNLNGGAIAFVSSSNVMIKTLVRGPVARIEIYNGDVTTAMGWKRAPNTVMEPDVTVAAATTPGNDLRKLSDPLDFMDPMVTRNSTNITYQLSDVAGLAPGTYQVYAYCIPKSGKVTGFAAPVGMGHAMFQVGTVTAEKKIATNCADCHGDTIYHLTSGPIHPEPFDTDYCTACHDYARSATGELFKNQGGTSLAGWSGYGAMPISRRVHAVHYAHYLEHSEEIYANATKATFGDIIFPQDMRNCTKCHAETTTWTQNPSRVACLACHDSDAAKAHGKIMTFMGDSDPYGPNAVESCEICHGADAEFSPDKVHRISNPYVPPYPREP